jgi:hypothetical protein
MNDVTWCRNDARYWDVTRSVLGDWVVYDTRSDRVVKRFQTAQQALAWVDAVVRGEVG